MLAQTSFFHFRSFFTPKQFVLLFFQDQTRLRTRRVELKRKKIREIYEQTFRTEQYSRNKENI